MDKLMTPDFSRVLILLGIGFVSLSTILGLLASKIKAAFKPLSKRAIIYLLVTALLFGGTALLVATGMFNTYTGYFMFFQFLFLLYGVAHVYLMGNNMPWGKDKALLPDVLFTLFILAAGAITFLLAWRLVNREGMEFVMMTALLFFPAPLLIVYTFRRAMEIPPRIMKQWHYPVQQPIEDPDEAKLKNLLLISFEFQKKGDEHWFTNFRAKAPTDMELGQLFYYFINDYNERHPQERIHYVNGHGDPCGWMFYKKPRWYTVFTRYMDADRTIFTNSIRENDVIVCARIINN